MNEIVTYEYYTDEFLVGRPSPLIPEPYWGSLERLAWSHINLRKIDLSQIPIHEILKDTLCAVAEALYRKSKTPSAGEIIEERNFSTGWKAKDGKTSEIDTEIKNIIAMRLAETEYHNMFVNRGV